MNILLDLDGTLTDPRRGFVASINHALTSVGREAALEADIAAHIGPPLEETLTLLLGPGQEHKLLPAISLYRERYSESGIFECSVYEGIPETLRLLQAGALRLFIATSKPRVFAVRILERFGLLPFLSAVYGSELDGTNADKRCLVAHILKQESLDPESTVMVGDRGQDVRAAQANGMASVGVLWGYGSRQELESAGASAIADHPRWLVGGLSTVRRPQKNLLRRD